MAAEALRVLYVSPECTPLAKVGGLGDVAAALPAALKALHVDVRVLLPGYPAVLEHAGTPEVAENLALLKPALASRLLISSLPAGVPLFILDCPRLYRRGGGPYQDESGNDWADSGLRFGLLSRAAALLGGADSPLRWRPDIVHVNDWPAALACAYLHYATGPRAATLMTAHNLAFQGNFDRALLDTLGLPSESFTPEGLEFHGRLSFLKAGLHYADAITTVSPTYAREIQSEALGAGMHGVLHRRREILRGILNGIDAAAWNPASDPHLPWHYSAATLERKTLVKRALQQRLGLACADEAVPLLGMVGRLTHQKGVDLVAAAAPDLLTLPAQLAVLGTGQPEYEAALQSLAEQHPGKIAVTTGFDEALAHLIEAGADMFLMPSRFEPCGLNQMYSQRYGTPPVARRTGGLADTITDCTPAALADGTATGFLFEEPSAPALVAALHRAIAVYRERDKWRSLQRNGMARDFSWTAPARQYAALYLRLAAGRRSPE